MDAITSVIWYTRQSTQGEGAASRALGEGLTHKIMSHFRSHLVVLPSQVSHTSRIVLVVRIGSLLFQAKNYYSVKCFPKVC